MKKGYEVQTLLCKKCNQSYMILKRADNYYWAECAICNNKTWEFLELPKTIKKDHVGEFRTN